MKWNIVEHKYSQTRQFFIPLKIHDTYSQLPNLPAVWIKIFPWFKHVDATAGAYDFHGSTTNSQRNLAVWHLSESDDVRNYR